MLDLEVRADILKTAMLEDRQEIRLIKGRIYELSSILTGFSFAVTAFLVGRSQPSVNPGLFFVLVDVSFLALLWASFLRLKVDLDIARKCLEAREDMIRGLKADDDTQFNPFPFVSWADKPRISENGLYWIVSLATLAIVSKMLVMALRIVS